MNTSTLKATASAWTLDTFPNRNNSGITRIYLSTGTTHRRGWIWFPRPIPPGATILTANLRLTFHQGWAGKSFHLSVYRITEAWKASKITDANAPTYDNSIDGGDDLSGLSTDQERVFDIAEVLAPIAAGSPWYGLRIGIPSGDATGDFQTLFSAEAPMGQPTLEISYSIAPNAPTDLRPSSGHAVADANPILSWTFSSPSGDAAQVESQVQASDSTDFSAPTWDTNFEANTASSRVLGIDAAEGVPVYWRVRVRDDTGETSDWSDAASFVYEPPGTVEITFPIGDEPDSTPTIAHTFTGTQVAAQWLITDPGGVLLHDSGIKATADGFYTLPLGVITSEGAAYTVEVRVWDDSDREATPGLPAYASARSDFSYAPSTDVAPIDDLTATARDDPGVALEWTYAPGAEWYVVLIDGAIVIDGLTPEDLGGGPTYHLTYWRAAPGRSHTFEVRAAVDDAGTIKHSADNTIAELASTVAGIWIMRPSTGDAVQLWGQAQAGFEIGEDTTVFTPAGRSDPVLGTASLRGDEGSISGVILDAEDGSIFADEGARMLRAFKGLAGTDELRAAWGPYNIAILLLPGAHIDARPSGGYDVELPVAQILEPNLPSAQADPLGWGEGGWGD